MGRGGFDSAMTWGSDQISKLLTPLGRLVCLPAWLQDAPMGEQFLQERTRFFFAIRQETPRANPSGKSSIISRDILSTSMWSEFRPA